MASPCPPTPRTAPPGVSDSPPEPRPARARAWAAMPLGRPPRRPDRQAVLTRGYVDAARRHPRSRDRRGAPWRRGGSGMDSGATSGGRSSWRPAGGAGSRRGARRRRLPRPGRERAITDLRRRAAFTGVLARPISPGPRAARSERAARLRRDRPTPSTPAALAASEDVYDQLRQVFDPEIPVNIVGSASSTTSRSRSRRSSSR